MKIYCKLKIKVIDRHYCLWLYYSKDKYMFNCEDLCLKSGIYNI